MLIQSDASQLEWRTAVWLANDEIGIRELNDSGIDIHSNNQSDLSLPSRLIAKIFLFRTIFRGTGWAFANDADFVHVSSDPRYWDEKNEKFYKKYYGLDRKHREWFKTVAEGRNIVSPFGREWKIPLQEKKGELVVPINMASNYPVQGTGADIMAIARLTFKQRQQTGKLISTVHDSVVADVPDKDVQQTANIMYEVFDDLPVTIKKLFNIDLPIKFPCEVKYGPNLKEMKKIEYTKY